MVRHQKTFTICRSKDMDKYNRSNFFCYFDGKILDEGVFLDYDIEGESIHICKECIDKLTELRQKL